MIFPGTARTPIGDDRLGQRLHKIGLQPRQDHSTALFILAAELPTAILAWMRGFHVQVAMQWHKASAGDWAAYAAHVSRRSSPGPAPSAPTAPRQQGSRMNSNNTCVTSTGGPLILDPAAGTSAG